MWNKRITAVAVWAWLCCLVKLKVHMFWLFCFGGFFFSLTWKIHPTPTSVSLFFSMVWLDLTVSRRRITYFKFPVLKRKNTSNHFLSIFPSLVIKHINETGRKDNKIVLPVGVITWFNIIITTKKLLQLEYSFFPDLKDILFSVSF